MCVCECRAEEEMCLVCCYLNLPLTIGEKPVPKKVTSLDTPRCRALEGRMDSI